MFERVEQMTRCLGVNRLCRGHVVALTGRPEQRRQTSKAAQNIEGCLRSPVDGRILTTEPIQHHRTVGVGDVCNAGDMTVVFYFDSIKEPEQTAQGMPRTL